jgi:hypothetical protein
MMSDYEYTSNSESESDDEIFKEFCQEDWQDWNSEVLLNLWMSIVEYHENWYLPLHRSFNDFCEFVYKDPEECEITFQPPEVQAIKNHPLIRCHDWNYFFSLSYK